MHVLLASFTYTPIQRWGPISPHGIGTALGFLLGAMLMARRAEPRGIPRNDVYNAVTWGAVGALLGARGFYVLGHWSQFASVKDMFAVWQGGLTMFGGFAGGLALGLWNLRRHGFDIGHALDAAAPGFAVGVIIGRVGDLVIADHLGRRTHFFLGYKIPNAPLAPGYGPPNYVPGMVVHHTALYDLVGTLVLLGGLYLVERRRPTKGTLFAVFCVWYGAQRFLIDFTRNRGVIESFFAGLSGSQWAALLFAVGGTYAIIRPRPGAASAPPEAAPPVPAGVAHVPAEAPPSPWTAEFPSMPVPERSPVIHPPPTPAPVPPPDPSPAQTPAMPDASPWAVPEAPSADPEAPPPAPEPAPAPWTPPPPATGAPGPEHSAEPQPPDDPSS